MQLVSMQEGDGDLDVTRIGSFNNDNIAANFLFQNQIIMSHSKSTGSTKTYFLYFNSPQCNKRNFSKDTDL